MISLESKRGFAELFPEGIDPLMHLRETNELAFQFTLPWKVNERDADEHRQDALSWQHQHRHSG